MKKTFEQFVKDYNIDLAKCELNSSETQLYEGANIHVTYISLDKPVDDQNYLVLSERLARRIYAKHDIKVLRDADAKYDAKYGWGLVCHSSERTFDVDLSTVFSDTEEDNNVIFIDNDGKEPNTDLDKLKEALYRLRDSIDAKTNNIRPRHRYDSIIIDKDNYIADIDYVDEDEFGWHGTSRLSGETFSTSILDNIDRFVDKFETIMMCRELAKSLDLELYCCAENGMKRYPMPDIIIDFPAGAVALDDNYISETKEENLYRIPSENYVGIDDNGYEEVGYKRIRKVLRRFIEDYYKVNLFEVDD